jgi:putative CocE/NonD family hydrolase
VHDKDVNIDVDAFQYMYSLLVKGEEPKHEVLVYSIGQDEWLHLDEWPVEPRQKEVYYLTAQHQQNGKPYILARSEKELKKKALLQFTYDPQNPVMSVGGETLFTSEKIRGSLPQPDMGYRPDVISFISQPLTEDMTIDGKIRAVVYMSTDVDDTALMFKVSEVFPDGTAYNIRTGVTTLAYRNNRLGARQKYTPGEVVELNLEALPILWQVKKGHRIRIDVTSSNFPEYSIHSNYAGVWSHQRLTRKAHQTIYVDPQHPSRVEIPVR